MIKTTEDPIVHKVMEPFNLSHSEAFRSLESEAVRLKSQGLMGLQSESDRLKRWVLNGPAGWRFDFSKQLMDEAAWDRLQSFAMEAGWESARSKQFSGERINATEDRAVLHMALRGAASDEFKVDGDDVMPAVVATREAMLAFVDRVRSGEYAAADGERFTHVVNIGIGGSDLGPVMVHEALAPMRQGGAQTLDVRFVSNVDPFHLDDVIRDLDPARTLVVIVSKTFTTQETMANARRASEWLRQGVGDVAAAGRQMAAVSSNIEGAEAFGIDAARVFGFSDWVGGRFSLWGPVGLSIALGSGSEVFRQLLDGARSMDLHFREAPAERNIPLHLALLEVWNVNVLGYPSRAVLPYAQALCSWPAYLQQAEMESNGKSVGRDGTDTGWQTAPVVWGAAGTNGQHAFHQLLHQGSQVHPMDFVAFIEPMGGDADMHRMLLANAIAQAEAFCAGRSSEQVRAEMLQSGVSVEAVDRIAPHRVFSGGRPSTFMLAERLDAHSLGALIAAHEHKIFLEGLFWGVFSFDQWGVELGKVLANSILSEGAGRGEWSPGTAALLSAARCFTP